MTVRVAISLSFLTIFAILLLKSLWNFESAAFGFTILFYGWVSMKIIEEGLGAILWLILRYVIDKHKDPPK